MTTESRRWSDEELSQFHNEFLLHQKHEEEVQRTLAASVEANTKMVCEVHDNTEDLLAVFETMKGGLKFIIVLGRVIKWAAGILVAASLLWYTYKNGTPPSPKV